MVDALAANGLGKRYGRRWALRGVDLGLPEGSVAALVGPNGAGKTTLLQLVVGLLSPEEGELRVLGRRPGPESLADIGFVAQDKPLYRRWRVRDMLRLGRELNRRWDQRYALRRLGELRVDPARRVGELSGGQQAQVALTLALAKRPRLILLDEPAASLDPLARREFLGTVSEEARAGGLTVVHSSHDLAELDRACDHLIVIRDASVVLAGDLVDVLPTGVPLEDLILSTLRHGDRAEVTP
jgi:ABC-2 type transport system ATP-binding protein